jgi:hypothetical protein
MKICCVSPTDAFTNPNFIYEFVIVWFLIYNLLHNCNGIGNISACFTFQFLTTVRFLLSIICFYCYFCVKVTSGLFHSVTVNMNISSIVTYFN